MKGESFRFRTITRSVAFVRLLECGLFHNTSNGSRLFQSAARHDPPPRVVSTCAYEEASPGSGLAGEVSNNPLFPAA